MSDVCRVVIVLVRLDAQFAEHQFKTAKEFGAFEHGVNPAVCDAVISFEWLRVVHLVMFGRQDQA